MTTTSQTFELDKSKVFVAGLFWTPLHSATTSARMAEVQKLAQEGDGADLFVMRTSGVPQVGLGSSSSIGRRQTDGIQKGMYSAAAVISKTVEVEGGEKSFLCAVKIDSNRYYYCAQSEGIILHDGDIIGSEDEIRARMMSDVAGNDWKLIYAPRHWTITGSSDREFQSFLPVNGKGRVAYKTWWALRPISNGKINFRRILPLLVIGLLVVGGFSGWKYYEKQKMEKELAELAALQAAAASGKSQQPVVLPWKNSPSAIDFVAGCDSASASLVHHWPANWKMTENTCTNGVYTFGWARPEGAWLSQLLEIVPNANLAEDGNTATLQVPFKLVPSADEGAPEAVSRMRYLNNLSQQLSLGITFTRVAPPAPLPGVQAPPPPPYKEFDWKINGKSIPPALLAAQMQGPAFRITRITTVYKDGSTIWNLEGKQYVRN